MWGIDLERFPGIFRAHQWVRRHEIGLGMHGYKSQRVEWSKTWNMSGTLTWVKIERWQKGGANILQKKSLKDYHSHTSFRRPSNSQRLKWGAVQESLESMCQKSEILRTCSKDREERPKYREMDSRAMQDQPPRSRGTRQSIYIQVRVVVFTSHPIRVRPREAPLYVYPIEIAYFRAPKWPFPCPR